MIMIVVTIMPLFIANVALGLQYIATNLDIERPVARIMEYEYCGDAI